MGDLPRNFAAECLSFHLGMKQRLVIGSMTDVVACQPNSVKAFALKILRIVPGA